MNTILKVLLAQLLIIAVIAGVYFGYRYIKSMRVQEIHCEGKNLTYPETFSDCVDCHMLKTPEIVDDWYDSKHGIMLVKCGTCHGDPSGNGSLSFRAKPGDDICTKCHAPAVERMKEKHSESTLSCVSCHPYHQNPIHSNAYEKIVPSKILTF